MIENINKNEIVEALQLQTSVNKKTQEVTIKASSYNLKQLLCYFFEDTLAKNTMGLRLDLLKKPCYSDDLDDRSFPCEVCDVDITRACQFLSEHFGVDFTTQQIKDAFWAQAESNPYNPARKWLESLPKWDGIERIKCVPDLLKVSDDAKIATQVSFTRLLLSLIGTAYASLKEPCTPQTVFILGGRQGTGKSRFFRGLFPPFMRGEMLHEKAWCSEGGEAGERFNRSMVSGWLCVDSECEQLVKSSTQSLKSWATTCVESFRPLYRSAVRVPRWFVIAGCTNQDQILRDETGARRWDLIFSNATEEDPIDVITLEKNRDQLFSEALHLFLAPIAQGGCGGCVSELNEWLWDNKEKWQGMLDCYSAYMQKTREDSYQSDVLEPAVLQYLEEHSDRASHTQLENPITVIDIIKALDDEGGNAALLKGNATLTARRIERILTKNGYRESRGIGSKGKRGWRKIVRNR